jgi:uncharacterized protein (TIRG00374 family)
LSTNTNKTGIFFLKIIASIALLIVLAWMVDPGEVMLSISGADAIILAFAVVMAASNRVLMAIKWNVLAKAIGVGVPQSIAIRSYFASTFAGIFLPPTIGADAVRTYILSRAKSRTTDIISSILIERVLGLVILAVFGLVGVAILVYQFSEYVPAANQIAWLIGGSALALFAGASFLTTPTFSRLLKYMAGKFESRGHRYLGAAKLIQDVYTSCVAYKDKPGSVMSFSALTVLENILVIIRAWLVAIAFGVDVGVFLFFIVVPIEQFLIRLPISIDGFGIREGLFLYALTSVGISPATAFAVGLTNHLIFIVAVTPGAWLLWSSSAMNKVAEDRK